MDEGLFRCLPPQDQSYQHSRVVYGMFFSIMYPYFRRCLLGMWHMDSGSFIFIPQQTGGCSAVHCRAMSDTA